MLYANFLIGLFAYLFTDLFPNWTPALLICCLTEQLQNMVVSTFNPHSESFVAPSPKPGTRYVFDRYLFNKIYYTKLLYERIIACVLLRWKGGVYNDNIIYATMTFWPNYKFLNFWSKKKLPIVLLMLSS